MKEKEKLLSLFDKEVEFRKFISKDTYWLEKVLFRYWIKVLFLILIIALFLFLINTILIFKEYRTINDFLSLIVLILSIIIFCFVWLDDVYIFYLIRRRHKKDLVYADYKKERSLILRKLQADYLHDIFFKKIEKEKVKKIKKSLKGDLKTFSNVFNMSDSTFAILLVPLGLAILQWYIDKVKELENFRVVYMYAVTYIIIVLAVFFTVKSIKNTFYIAKKEKYKRIINILELVEKKMKVL